MSILSDWILFRSYDLTESYFDPMI